MKRLTLLALSLLACSQSDGSFWAYGYKWEPNPYQPTCEAYLWNKDDPKQILKVCGPNKIGCVLKGTCVVISMYDEDTARKVVQWGQSRRDHEVEMHIRKKLQHPKGSV
jgi:hypothetical protein